MALKKYHVDVFQTPSALLLTLKTVWRVSVSEAISKNVCHCGNEQSGNKQFKPNYLGIYSNYRAKAIKLHE